MGGLEKKDLLEKLKSCVVWELLPFSELQREYESLHISGTACSLDMSMEEMRVELLDKLLVHSCRDAYEARGVPASRLASMSLVRYVAERFNNLEAMSVADLALEANKLGLPTRKNSSKKDLLRHLKDVVVWTTLPLEELRHECTMHEVSIKDLEFDIETGDEEIRNQLLDKLLFHSFATSFESLGVPVRCLTSFHACATVVQAWSSIDELSNSEATRRYMDLGCFPVQHVIRLDGADIIERLKKVSLWMELPFVDLQRECRANDVNSIAREDQRDELILRLVAKLWCPSAPLLKPPPPSKPPQRPQMQQPQRGGAWPGRSSNPPGPQPGPHWKAHMPPESGPWSPGGQARVSDTLAPHYDTLGLKPDAGSEEVRKAYRALALKYHPDKNQGDDDAAQQFRSVLEAYQALAAHLKINK